MLDCCTRLKNEVPLLLKDDRTKKSLDEQLGCMCESCCIADIDILCRVTDDAKNTAEGLLKDVEKITFRRPKVKFDDIDGEKTISIIASHTYAMKIRKVFSVMGIDGKSDYSLNGIRILLIESLCEKREKYSENCLIGKILALADVLYLSEYFEIDTYPQISLALEGKLRYAYNFAFLHELAVYVAIHEESINWEDILDTLSSLSVNTPLIILLKLFNHIYRLIPEEILAEFIENAKIDDVTLPSFEILRCINKYCTLNEILNNDYRNFYHACHTTENSNGRKYTYPIFEDELSFDESRIQYTLDHDTENPYGTPVFHGNANDKSDQLSVKWGVWGYRDKLCFLLRIHNKFIVPENPAEYLDKCHTVIALSGADETSHKLTELLIKPQFTEWGKLSFKIKDGCEGDLSLNDHIEYRYKFDGDDIIFTLAVDKSYLHIPDDGMFGIDVLISCSEPWSDDRFEDDFRKSLTWTGCQKLWRDLRSHAVMEME